MVALRTPLPSPASVGISQDNIIFGMIFLSFLIYITMKGELRTYMGFFAPTSGGGGGGGAAPNNQITNPKGYDLGGGINLPFGLGKIPGLVLGGPVGNIIGKIFGGTPTGGQ